MATGESLLSLEQIFVIAEMEIVCELQGDVRKAIAALYAIYYILDIAYPRECKNTLLLIEKMFWGIHGEKLPQSLVGTISNIEKL